jgi:hypothetical protein
VRPSDERKDVTMARGRDELTACVVAAAIALGLASPARAGTGTGTFTLARQADAATPAARADWALDGTVLAARAEAPLVGVTPDAGLTDTDSRYVHATLQSAQQDPVVTDCGDETGGTTTVGFGGVVSAASVFEVELSLNLLTGRGTAHLGVAATPWQGAEGLDFAPGTTNSTSHSTCYGSVDDRSAVVDVIRDGGEAMFTASVGRQVNELSWRLTRGAGGVWRMQGTRRFNADSAYTASAAATFAGTPASLHATCTMPTVHSLAPARTPKQARRILARAGFPHVLARAKMTRAARRGRYFIDEAVGNSTPVRCGYRRLHLVRSLGWPSG